jgi:S-formylglutathione hydrolase
MNGTWTSVAIAGKPADVYSPAGTERPRFAVLHLHGVGLETLRDRPAFTRLFDELGLGCVCPLGQRCWWTDRICPEFDPLVTPEKHLLDGVLPFFKERWGLEPRAIGLQGISMGGQGALRLAFKYPQLFPVVAALAPAIEYHELYGQGTPLDEMYDSKEQCRQDSAIMHVPPHHPPPHIFFCIDPADSRWFRGNDRLHEKLNALGVPHEIDLTTRAGGHSWDYFNHMAERVERFVHAGLEQESRRLL